MSTTVKSQIHATAKAARKVVAGPEETLFVFRLYSQTVLTGDRFVSVVLPSGERDNFVAQSNVEKFARTEAERIATNIYPQKEYCDGAKRAAVRVEEWTA